MTSLHARLSSFVLVMVAALALIALPAAARAQSATGAIDGIVVDQQNAVLPGVTITVTAVATGVKRSTVTDDKGMFRNPLLPVGDYEVLAELPGFKPQKQTEIHVMIGQSLTLRIEMAVGGVVETVTVAGSTPVVETSRDRKSTRLNSSHCTPSRMPSSA